jgi:UDP-glucose 4-epimerase
MRVLVTGGAGYIGSHTIVELLGAGHEVVAVDNLVNSSAESLRRAERIAGRSMTFVQADLRDQVAVDDIFGAHTIDAVVHFAALKSVGESVAKPIDYYRNNVDATLTLCEAMEAHGVGQLIFSSSATVYGTPSELPLRETSRVGLGITNPYGQTKYMLEQILRDIVVAKPAWQVTLLRYFNPIGAHESGLIGEDPHGTPNNLLPYVGRVAVGALSKLQVFGDDYDTPDGTGVRDYIHVVDLARGHLSALTHPPEPGTVATYKLCS